MWVWHEGMGWWMAFGGILFVLFWGGVIALIVLVIIKASNRGETSKKIDHSISQKNDMLKVKYQKKNLRR